ncbi:MAG: alpha/beta hydrolase [Chloroflexota bacterium]|nr:alpha/beta hydrolase [Chloroflexota bacterium]
MSTTQTPRLLVVPGLDGDPRLLLSVAPRLFPGTRVLLFDHSRDRAEGGLEGLAARAIALLDADAEGTAPAYVCGESFGGTVALTLAYLYPQRVRGLILLSTFGCYPAASSRFGRLGLLLWRALGDRVARHLLRAWRPISVPGALGVGMRYSREVLRAYLAWPEFDLAAYRAKCELALRFDARPWLAEVTCPSFLLVGTWDPVVPTAAGRELARGMPNAELRSLPGGHLVHILRAAEAGELIGRWIGPDPVRSTAC